MRLVKYILRKGAYEIKSLQIAKIMANEDFQNYLQAAQQIVANSVSQSTLTQVNNLRSKRILNEVRIILVSKMLEIVARILQHPLHPRT